MADKAKTASKSTRSGDQNPNGVNEPTTSGLRSSPRHRTPSTVLQAGGTSAVIPRPVTRNSIPVAPPAKGKRGANPPPSSAKSATRDPRPSPAKRIPPAPAKKANAPPSPAKVNPRARPPRSVRLAARNAARNGNQPSVDHVEQSSHASDEASRQVSVAAERSGDEQSGEQSGDEQPGDEQSERSSRASGEASKQASSEAEERAEEQSSGEPSGRASAKSDGDDNQVEDNSPPSGAAKSQVSSDPDATQVIAPQDSADPDATQVIARTNVPMDSPQDEGDELPPSADPTILPAQNSEHDTLHTTFTDKEIEEKLGMVEEEIEVPAEDTSKEGEDVVNEKSQAAKSPTTESTPKKAKSKKGKKKTQDDDSADEDKDSAPSSKKSKLVGKNNNTPPSSPAEKERGTGKKRKASDDDDNPSPKKKKRIIVSDDEDSAPSPDLFSSDDEAVVKKKQLRQKDGSVLFRGKFRPPFDQLYMGVDKKAAVQEEELDEEYSGRRDSETQHTVKKTGVFRRQKHKLEKQKGNKKRPLTDEQKAELKKHRAVQAFKEMRFYKQSSGVFFSKKGFGYLVREIVQENVSPKLKDEIRIQKPAIQLLQYGAEYFISDMFSMAQLAAIHAKRETIMLQDMLLLYEIHNRDNGPIMKNLKSGVQAYKEKKARKEGQATKDALNKSKK